MNTIRFTHSQDINVQRALYSEHGFYYAGEKRLIVASSA